MVKNLLTMQETQVRSLSQEDPLKKEMSTHSSIHAWEIPWTEEPGRLQSMDSQKSQTQPSNQTTTAFTGDGHYVSNTLWNSWERRACFALYMQLSDIIEVVSRKPCKKLQQWGQRKTWVSFSQNGLALLSNELSQLKDSVWVSLTPPGWGHHSRACHFKHPEWKSGLRGDQWGCCVLPKPCVDSGKDPGLWEVRSQIGRASCRERVYSYV